LGEKVRKRAETKAKKSVSIELGKTREGPTIQEKGSARSPDKRKLRKKKNTLTVVDPKRKRKRPQK